MIKNDKVFRVVSILNFILHICVFAFVTVAGFLPFREDQNFYACFTGFFGKTLSAMQPYLLMAILLSTCVLAFFAIRQPALSGINLILALVFFVIVILPFSFEAMIVGLTSPWIGGAGMSTYQIGFDLICGASYIFYLDAAFLVYSVITIIIRIKRSS